MPNDRLNSFVLLFLNDGNNVGKLLIKPKERAQKCL
jgi:hypothetical protein